MALPKSSEPDVAAPARRPRVSLGEAAKVSLGNKLHALTAAAVRVNSSNARTMRRLVQPWQILTLAYYDQVGEAWAAANFYGRNLKKLRLFVGQRTGDGEIEETDNQQAQQVLARIQDPSGGGYSQLLESYGRLKFLIGEGYFLVTNPNGDDEEWEFVSPDELRVNGKDSYTRFQSPSLPADELSAIPDDDYEPVPGSAMVYRVWRPHPRFSRLADSSVRAQLKTLEELQLLSLAIGATAKNRMARNGILYLPESLDSPPVDPSADEDPSHQTILRDITEQLVSPLVNPGTAAAASPFLMMGPDDIGDKIKWIEVSDASQTYPEEGIRTELIRRFAVGVDLPASALTGVEDLNHWCVDADTEVLTRDRGWLHHDDLAVGDVVRTLNHESGLAEWQPVEDIYRADVTDEPMIRIESRTHSSLSTPNHRWPVLKLGQQDGETATRRVWTTSEEFEVADAIITGAPSADLPFAPMHPDELVELVAWAWTEGHHPASAISIAQSHTVHPDNVERIRGCLTRLFGAAVENCRNQDGPAWREAIQLNTTSFGGPITVFHLNRHAASRVWEHAPGGVVTAEFVRQLTSAQLDLFIHTSCRADGHHYHAGIIDIWQRDPGDLAAFELALILAGHAVSRITGSDGGTTVRAVRSVTVRPVKAAYEAERRRIDGAIVERTTYTGTIWCPTTKNHTWLARRRGRTFYTGNTGWLVDEQGFRDYVMPACEDLTADLTKTFLRPVLRKEGVDDWDSFVVGYDAAAVIAHPNRYTDAKDAHDRLVISDQALRDAGNFNDGDAPSDEEWQRRAALKLLDPSALTDPYVAPVTPAVNQDEEQTGVEGAPQGNGDVDAGAPATQPVDAAEAPAANGRPAGTLAGYVEAACALAVTQCRERAGARLRSRMQGDNVDVPREALLAENTNLASALGPEWVRARALNELELVHGGERALEKQLSLWRLDAETTRGLAEMVRTHAARTLYQPDQPPLPRRVAAYIEQVTAAGERAA